jgi:hypothetical protein
MICLGFISGPIPGPGGIPLVLLGLAVMASEFVWAERLMVVFKTQLGFNQFIWERFDAAFRLVIARRNIILLIVTVGLLTGTLVGSFVVAAVWSLASSVIQAVRLIQGWSRRPIVSYLCNDEGMALPVSRSPSAFRNP